MLQTLPEDPDVVVHKKNGLFRSDKNGGLSLMMDLENDSEIHAVNESGGSFFKIAL